MLTALEKHRRTARHSTDWRGETNHCLISIYTVYIHTYTYTLLATLPQTAGASAQSKRLSFSGCVMIKSISCSSFNAQCAEVIIKRVKETKIPQHWSFLSVGSQVLHQTSKQRRGKSIQSAEVEHHLVTEPGRAGRSSHDSKELFATLILLKLLWQKN